MNQSTDPATNRPQFPMVSGRLVVLTMLGFGCLATGTLWVYSKMELAPFLPLLKALDEEFPKSNPNVKGGRAKKQAPRLRIVMQVNFPPTETDERVVKIVDRVIALAKEHVDLAEFEDFELHLVQYVPEKNPQRILIERKIKDL